MERASPGDFQLYFAESAFPSCVPVGSYSGREARSLSFLPSFPSLSVPWDGSEVSRAGQGGVFLVRSASLLSKAPGMGFQLLNPSAAAARALRTRCGGCGDSLGAQGFGASPFAASALPRPPPRFPCSEVSGASHPLGLPGPPPPPSGLSYPSRLSAAPTPTLQRRCVPRALARLPLQLSALSAFKRSPGHSLTLWAKPLEDLPRGWPKVPRAERPGSSRDWQP